MIHLLPRPIVGLGPRVGGADGDRDYHKLVRIKPLSSNKSQVRIATQTEAN